MSGNRKNGKNMVLWMSDDLTDPTSANAVLSNTGYTFSSRANVSNVTAAGDEWAHKCGGIPDGSIRVTGRLRFDGADRLFAAHAAQDIRKCFFVYDDDVEADRLEFLAIVSEYGSNAQHTSPLDFSVSLEITDAVGDTRS